MKGNVENEPELWCVVGFRVGSREMREKGLNRVLAKKVRGRERLRYVAEKILLMRGKFAQAAGNQGWKM